MLERIELVQGIGLLHDANGKPYKCHKATLVYADNGRGKSTLASVLRAASTGDATRMNACRTVDGTLGPKATLQFASGHRVFFENNAWSEARPELLVFDAHFVELNVHSGGVVNTNHRKNLLDFALGESSVAARAAVQQATDEASKVGQLILSYTGQLSGYHTGYTLKDFEELPELSDIDSLILEAQRRIGEATNAATIRAKAVPAPLSEPDFDVDSLFSGLALSLADVHASAERVVKEHIAKLERTGAERWLSEGHRFQNGDACPYCAQDIKANDLVRAYQTHFNEAYNELKATVTRLVERFTRCTSADILVTLQRDFRLSVAHASAWQEHLELPEITFDEAAVGAELSPLRGIVLNLLGVKGDRPADALGDQTLKEICSAHWQALLIPIRAANTAIAAAAELINTYRAQLIAESLPSLRQDLQRLEATKRRYEPAVTSLFANLTEARREETRANTAKQNARETLDQEMEITLSKYQASINSILAKFGAGFSIKGLGANFRGHAPRSEYGLLLRGKEIPLEGGPPSFATALSEGDKRTLAFAFFIACTLDDPKLGNRVVIIDDPMCSLDSNRKRQTRLLLKNIHRKAEQLIVLAHDPYFLRDLRDAIRKEDKTASIGYSRLVAVQNEYTSFDVLDIDQECESSYSQHHRVLNEFSAGIGTNAAAAAKAIRPMLEGYLHRRFPGLINKDLMFGQVVISIRDAVHPSPLCHAANLVEELNEINDYAGEFHHETDGDANCVAVNPSELRPYVQRALCVVHKGAPLV
jgi:wobble nucleotide-excising tRNase